MHPLPVALLLLFCQVLLTVRAASRPESRAAYRETLLAFPNSAPPGFTSMPAVDTGVLFTNVLTEVRATANRILEDGSGIALGDVDGDGNCDIYLGRLEGPNALYRNLGNWKFDDVTAEAGVACDGQFSTGSAFADIDSDGDLDLLVNGVGVGTRLFLNDGKGHFRESSESGLLRKYGSTSLALADIDGDGDLDLYVTNYRSDTVRDAPPGVKAEFFRAPDGQVIVEPADRFDFWLSLKARRESTWWSEASRTSCIGTTGKGYLLRSPGQTGPSWTKRADRFEALLCSGG